MRFREEINEFQQWDAKNTPAKDAILFVGSSSVRMWPTAKAFPTATIINRGFGGSTIPDVLDHMDKIVLPYKPKLIVFYSGDNDLAGNMSPQTVIDNFKVFAQRVHAALPKTPIIIGSIKQSPLRLKLTQQIKQTNQLLKEYCDSQDNIKLVDFTTCLLDQDGQPNNALFIKDRLHLNSDGYQAWNQQLQEHLEITAEI